MLQFFADYGSSIIIALVLLFIVFLVIKSMVKDKKSGKSSCGGSCASCGNYACCNANTEATTSMKKAK